MQARGAERPLSTSRRRISSPRPAGSARSPSPPTWPAAAPTSSSAAMSSSGSTTSSASMEAGPEARRRRSRRSSAEVAEEKERVIAAGGLFVLGTERHESRRIDNQLRGRSGRQGDPGLSPLLPEPRRRSAAHLRPADHVRADDEQESRRRRGDHLALDLQGDRDRAEEGRGAQLRHPQAGRRI